jgi:hypothetical protein
MDNIVNYYPINNHLEVCVCDDDGTSSVRHRQHRFGNRRSRSLITLLVSSASIPDSTITMENWEDFCAARGIFTEDN